MSDAFISQCIKAGIPSGVVLGIQGAIKAVETARQRLDAWDPENPSDKAWSFIDAYAEVENEVAKLAAELMDIGLPLTMEGAK